jgi:sarcosine oxidase, subunit gamma
MQQDNTTLDAGLRSPIAARFSENDVEWQLVNDYLAVARIGGANTSRAVTLCDLTHVARIGFKGAGTCDWLAEQGLAIPPTPNQIVVDDSGCIVARLGQQDLLIIGTLEAHSDRPRQLEHQWRSVTNPGGYPTPKQTSHALFHVGGEQASVLLASVCAVDLRPRTFGVNDLAQTMAAGIVATFMRADRGGVIGYLVLVDTSLAEYFWDVLVDACVEFQAGIIGYRQLPARD